MKKWIDKSSRFISLPYPQFVVFYNGKKEEPERQTLHLSDAFPESGSREAAALQCSAVVLNINMGHQSDLMTKCRKLKEYAIFIGKVREYLDQGAIIQEAVNQAVDDCIKNGILAKILQENREEVCSMLLTEYDEQAHIESEREIAIEEGRLEENIKIVLDFLEELGMLPETLEQDIRKEQDLSVLRKWTKLAARVSTIDEFIKVYRK